MTKARATTATVAATDELKDLRRHIGDRQQREAIRAALDHGDYSFSLGELEQIAQSTGEGLENPNNHTLLTSEYLEALAERIGWWMSAADIALWSLGIAPERSEPWFYRLRNLLPEVLALIPGAWGETYPHQGAHCRPLTVGRKLVTRYLDFREAVCMAIEEVWQSREDRALFEDMRQLG